MLDAMRKILDRGKAHYQSHCREKAVSQYEKERQYMKYVELYRRIIKNEKSQDFNNYNHLQQ